MRANGLAHGVLHDQDLEQHLSRLRLAAQLHASLGDQQVVEADHGDATLWASSVLIASAASSHARLAPTAVRQVVDLMFLNFFGSRSPGVCGHASRRTLLLSILELHDLALALHVGAVVVVALVDAVILLSCRLEVHVR